MVKTHHIHHMCRSIKTVGIRVSIGDYFYAWMTTKTFHFSIITSYETSWENLSFSEIHVNEKKSINKWTRGPWATSLTWKTDPINKHICAWYDYAITLIKEEKRHYLLFENWVVLICLRLNTHHAVLEALCPVWLKLA